MTAERASPRARDISVPAVRMHASALKDSLDNKTHLAAEPAAIRQERTP
jgi:hypothetical protein